MVSMGVWVRCRRSEVRRQGSEVVDQQSGARGWWLRLAGFFQQAAERGQLVGRQVAERLLVELLERLVNLVQDFERSRGAGHVNHAAVVVASFAFDKACAFQTVD